MMAEPSEHFERDVASGMLEVDVRMFVPMAYHSVGGWTQSFFEELHIQGPEGVEFYMRGSLVTRAWIDPLHRGADLGFQMAD